MRMCMHTCASCHTCKCSAMDSVIVHFVSCPSDIQSIALQPVSEAAEPEPVPPPPPPPDEEEELADPFALLRGESPEVCLLIG